MKQVNVSQELIDRTSRKLDEIEQDVFGEDLRVKTGVKAGGCKPGTCEQPLYGVPTASS